MLFNPCSGFNLIANIGNGSVKNDLPDRQSRLARHDNFFAGYIEGLFIPALLTRSVKKITDTLINEGIQTLKTISDFPQPAA